jgi:hypothetical protein
MAHAISGLGFEVLSKGVRGVVYFKAAALVASALGFEPPERKKEESLMDYIKDVTINAFLNNYFGGLPSAADAMAKFTGNFAYEMATGEEQDVVFTPKDFKDMAARSLGVYSGAISPVIDAGVMAQDTRKGKNVSEDRWYTTIGKLVADMVALSPLPFRGDISKGVQTYTSVNAQTRRENKKTSTGRPKRPVQRQRLKRTN